MTCGIGMAALAAVSVFVYQNGQVVRSELAHQWTVTATGDWVDGEADDLTTEKTILRDSGRQQIEPLAEAAPGTRCTLLELTSRTCRWPIGDPKKEDFCFCGATTPVRGRPYCEFHIGVAYSCAGATKVTEAKPRTERQPSLNRADDMLRPVAPGCPIGEMSAAARPELKPGG